MYAEMGLNVFAGLGEMFVSSEQAKLAKFQRKYNETMSALSAAQNMNAITDNEIATQDQSVYAKLSIQTAAMQESADYDVEAAAAGVMGKSVRMGSIQLQADEARADTSLSRQAAAQRRAHGQQRTQVDLQRIYGKDVSPLPKTNIAASLFKIGSGLIDTWDAHNPVDRQASTLLKRK
jgi:hypothetical protein